jgi:hypothetical protein
MPPLAASLTAARHLSDIFAIYKLLVFTGFMVGLVCWVWLVGFVFCGFSAKNATRYLRSWLGMMLAIILAGCLVGLAAIGLLT